MELTVHEVTPREVCEFLNREENFFPALFDLETEDLDFLNARKRNSAVNIVKGVVYYFDSRIGNILFFRDGEQFVTLVSPGYRDFRNRKDNSTKLVATMINGVVYNQQGEYICYPEINYITKRRKPIAKKYVPFKTLVELQQLANRDSEFNIFILEDTGIFNLETGVLYTSASYQIFTNFLSSQDTTKYKYLRLALELIDTILHSSIENATIETDSFSVKVAPGDNDCVMFILNYTGGSVTFLLTDKGLEQK